MRSLGYDQLRQAYKEKYGKPYPCLLYTSWHVLDGPLAAFAGCPVRMERRQRRAYVTAELGGVARRVRFGVLPVDGDAQ